MSMSVSPFVPVLYFFLFIYRVITLLFSELFQSLNLNLLLFFPCMFFFSSDYFVSDDLLLVVFPFLAHVMVFTTTCSEEEKI